ncbi:hypothetical protein GCM10020360_09810 [Nonlabens tegetincola]
MLHCFPCELGSPRVCANHARRCLAEAVVHIRRDPRGERPRLTDARELTQSDAETVTPLIVATAGVLDGERALSVPQPARCRGLLNDRELQ